MLAPLLIGIGLGDLVHGLPINSSHNFTGSFWDLFQPYAVYTGVTLVLVCLLHGATFLSLKTTDAMHERSRLAARRVAPFTAAAVTGYAIWTHVASSSTFFLRPLELLAILAVRAAVWLVNSGSEGFAFTATTVTIAACIVIIFLPLVLAYQGWTCYVFRRRVSVQSFRPQPPPAPPQQEMAGVPPQRSAARGGDRAKARPPRRGWLGRSRHGGRG